LVNNSNIVGNIGHILGQWRLWNGWKGLFVGIINYFFGNLGVFGLEKIKD
jgi:hypothetical protein